MTTMPRVTVNRHALTRRAMGLPATVTCVSTVAIAVLTLGGCATSVTGTKESVLPKNMKSMDEIYRDHTQRKFHDPQAPSPATPDPKGTTPQSATPPTHGNETAESLRHASWDGYTRSAATEIDNLFPTLPNPMLVMHVFAHLSGTENTPVPGYATAFPMYERVEFALPGELAYRHADVAGARPVPRTDPPEPARPDAVVTTAAPPGYLMTTSTPPEAVKAPGDPDAP